MRGPRDPRKPQNFPEPRCPQLQMVVSSVVVRVGAVTHLEGGRGAVDRGPVVVATKKQSLV